MQQSRADLEICTTLDSSDCALESEVAAFSAVACIPASLSVCPCLPQSHCAHSLLNFAEHPVPSSPGETQAKAGGEVKGHVSTLRLVHLQQTLS